MKCKEIEKYLLVVFHDVPIDIAVARCSICALCAKDEAGIIKTPEIAAFPTIIGKTYELV